MLIKSYNIFLIFPYWETNYLNTGHYFQDDDDSLVPSPLMLNSENVQEDGVYLLENGEDGLIYVGNMVNPATLEQIFGVSSLATLPVQASLILS